MQCGHTNADGNADGGPLVANQHLPRRHRLAQRLGQVQRIVRVGFRQHQHELLASITRHRVHALARARQAGLGHCANHAVARQVPPTVINRLEQVDINHHHRQRVPKPTGTLALVNAQFHQGAPVGQPGQRVIGCQQCQRGIELAQQGVLRSQLAVDLFHFDFPALAVVDVERHANQALARRAAVAIHDAAVAGIPDPLATPGSQPELAAVLGRVARQVVVHRFFHLAKIVWVKQPIDALQVGDDFLLAKAQFHERLGCVEGDLAGDEIVLPQVQPGGFQGQGQPVSVEVCVIHD